MERREAIDKAVDQCIDRGGPLAKIMQGHKAEVTDMLLTEYNEAFHIASEKEISRELGREEGRREERLNTEREKCRGDILALKLKGKTEEEIADTVGVTLEEVNQILSDI